MCSAGLNSSSIKLEIAMTDLRQRHLARNLEISGMAMLLFAAAWQLFFEDWANSETLTSYLNMINYKLDHLWRAQDTTLIPPYAEQTSGFYNLDYVKSDPWHTDIMAYVKFGLFGTGSTLHILGRIIEPINEK